MSKPVNPQLPRGFQHQPTVVLKRVLQDDVLNVILEQARRLGWRLLDLNLTRDDIPRAYNVVGAIGGLPIDHPNMQRLRDLECPVVRIGRLPHPLDHRVPAVIYDYAETGRLAAEHLAERNFEHLCFVAIKGAVFAETIWAAFRRRAEELGCTPHVMRIRSDNVIYGDELTARYRRRSRELRDWLEKLPKPVGLATASDNFAAKIVVMVQSSGLTVPEEVGVLGAGNGTAIYETASVPLSSVDIGRQLRAREAICLLDRLVKGEKPPASAVVIPPVGVVERQSTNVLAVPDPVAARAIRYIWDHLDLQVPVSDIAAQVGVSRRSLERAFQKSLGRTVNAERLRKRLERCTELLRGTQWTIEKVAATAGFPSPSYMHRAFRKEFGVSPGRFRKEARTETDSD